jgi:hypothetical protein
MNEDINLRLAAVSANYKELIPAVHRSDAILLAHAERKASTQIDSSDF